jgi:hypothetical protein
MIKKTSIILKTKEAVDAHMEQAIAIKKKKPMIRQFKAKLQRK